MQRIPVTPAGQKALREELDFLKKIERPRIIEAIKTARELGDLKENAEYHEAKREQGLIEGRIKYLEGVLSACQVIDVMKLSHTGKVVFGCTITIMNMSNEEEVTYQLVGEDEADIKKNKISVSSPIAQALLGKEEGDEVTVQTPSGLLKYEVVEVKYV